MKKEYIIRVYGEVGDEIIHMCYKDGDVNNIIINPPEELLGTFDRMRGFIDAISGEFER